MVFYDKNSPQSIQAMFGSIAQQYDKTNAALSFRLHQKWNKHLVYSVKQSELDSSLLDLCCGTGEIAFTYLNNSVHPCEMYLIDFCKEMLACAQEKAKRLDLHEHKLAYIQADVQEIPLANCSINCATMAYGIRNVQSPTLCLAEVYRVLKPDGLFGILELTQPTSSILRFGHKIYLTSILPLLGKFFTSNQAAYEYLCNSIKTFIRPEELKAMLEQAGFKNISIEPLNGGIATIILGQKKE
jgi:demethylmenaquinone methyltransferase/2-methoxy-6-polyprenyl-1,4-benzoquinol methylase